MAITGKRIRKPKTTQVLPHLDIPTDKENGLAPPNCVCHMEIGQKGHIYIIEHEPAIRTIFYAYNEDNGVDDAFRTTKSLALNMPRLLWIVCIANERPYSVELCATKEPFCKNGMNTSLYILPLPNQRDHGQGDICTGGGGFADCQGVPSRIATAFLDRVFESRWNLDLEVVIPTSLGRSLEAWAEKSGKKLKLFSRWPFKQKYKNNLAKALKYWKNRLYDATSLKHEPPPPLKTKPITGKKLPICNTPARVG